jgi:hypothetical protein
VKYFSKPFVSNQVLASLMISLHFFGVSSTLPAKKRQQVAITLRK